MRKAVLAMTVALLGAQALAAQSADTQTGDRRGRINDRVGDRANPRATPSTTSNWTDPVARDRTETRPYARSVSDAITYGREYRPR